MQTDLTQDHIGLTDTFASRRCVRKFETITGHLLRMAANMEAKTDERLARCSAEIVESMIRTGLADDKQN